MSEATSRGSPRFRIWSWDHLSEAGKEAWAWFHAADYLTSHGMAIPPTLGSRLLEVVQVWKREAAAMPDAPPYLPPEKAFTRSKPSQKGAEIALEDLPAEASVDDEHLRGWLASWDSLDGRLQQWLIYVVAIRFLIEEKWTGIRLEDLIDRAVRTLNTLSLTDGGGAVAS